MMDFQVLQAREGAEGALSLTVEIDGTDGVPPYRVIFTLSAALQDSWPVDAEARRAAMLAWIGIKAEERHTIEAASHATVQATARKLEPDEVSLLLRGETGKAAAFTVSGGTISIKS